MSRTAFYVVGLLVILCLACFFLWLREQNPMGGSEVEITYVGRENLSAVTLHFSGGSYYIGDMNKDRQTVRCIISPAFDSHIEVEFVAPSGQLRRVVAGGFLGPNIEISMNIVLDSERMISSKFEYR